MESEKGEQQVSPHDRATQLLSEMSREPNSPITKVEFPDTRYRSDEAFNIDNFDVSNCVWQLAEWHNAPLVTDTFPDREARGVWKSGIFNTISSSENKAVAHELNNLISTSKLAKVTEINTMLAYLGDADEPAFKELKEYNDQLPWNISESEEALLKDENEVTINTKYDRLSAEEKESVARRLDELVVPILEHFNIGQSH